MTNIFGDKGGIIVAVLLALVLYLIFKEKKATIWFATMVISSLLINTAIKMIIGRDRPEIHRLAAFANEAGKSFPVVTLYLQQLFLEVFSLFVLEN